MIKSTYYKKLKLFLSVFIIILIVSGITIANILFLYGNSPGPLEQNKIVAIPHHSSISKLTEILYQEKIIRYPILFLISAKIINNFNILKAGEYPFMQGISPNQIFKIMIEGHSVIHNVTIPEGLTVKQIVQKLNEIPFLVGEIQGDIKEGSLYPDSYHFIYGDTRQSLIKRMQNKMTEILEELWVNRAKNLPIKNKEEALILASIIEKETSLDSEKARIAGVFVNRLNKNMKLQADPTIIYAVSEGLGVLDHSLTKKELQIQSDYNTYYVKGLPPTAIANPGRSSIIAALNPMPTEDLYFVVDRLGGHNFSTNLKDHNKHVHNYVNSFKASNTAP